METGAVHPALVPLSQAVKPAAGDRLALQQAQQRVKGELQAEAAKAGAHANVSVQYQYAVGPDGQLYVVGGRVSTSERVVRDGAGEQQGGYAPVVPPLPNGFSEKIQLSPEDFAETFGLTGGEREHLRALKTADAEVRGHEALHFRAAGGLAQGLPQYSYQQGPDGAFYAVGGEVAVQTGVTADPEKARRDAQALAVAATAPGDASAQDMQAARGAFSRAAGLYAAVGEAIHSVEVTA